jgi:hypothetical protein
LSFLCPLRNGYPRQATVTTITKKRSAGIEGVSTWTVDGKQIDVAPGQALCIPRGAVHRFDNHGARDAKALCVITPAAIGPEYFREAFGVLNAANRGPPDKAKMMEIMLRHGLTPAPSQI